jgi:cytoskeleton protein RodZ
MKQDTETGIGRALRAARLRRGRSLEEASRELRLRAEYLDALEREAFGSLRDVYVRGFLRSYAKYLGLDSAKVLGVYERAHGRPRPVPAPVEQAPGVVPSEVEVLAGEHRRPSWFLAAAAAFIVLASAVALGVLARSEAPAPAPAEPPPAGPVLPQGVEANLIAHRDIQVQVAVDGGPVQTYPMVRLEGRSFEGEVRIDIFISDGGAVELEVNGRDLGRPGATGTPFQASYDPRSYREEPLSPPDR